MKSVWHFAMILFAMVIPLALTGNPYLTFVFTLIVVNSILVSDWSLLAGYMGLDNLAVGGMVGVGAYTSAYLAMKLGFSFWAAMPVAGVATAIIGVLLGFPSLRIKGLYFAVFSLMVQVVLTQVFTDWTGFTNGEAGIAGIPSPLLSLGSLRLVFTGTALAYLCVIVLLVWTFVYRYVTSGNRRLRLICVRDDETLATHLGINVVRERLMVFVLTSFVAGIAGALLGVLTSYVSPATTDIFLTVQVFAMAYVGGKGSLAGALLGTTIFTVLPNLFTIYYPYREFVEGILIVVTYVFLPQGLISISRVIGPKVRPKSVPESRSEVKH